MIGSSCLHRSRRTTWQGALAALAVLLVAGSAFAGPIIGNVPAVFIEAIGAGTDSVLGIGDDLPETISYDFGSAPGQLIATVATSSIGPNVDVQAHNTWGGLLSAIGRVEFGLRVVPADPTAPLDVPIPLLMQAQGDASVTVLDHSSGSFGYAWVRVKLLADASYSIGDFDDPDWGPIMGPDGLLVTSACAAEAPATCDGIPDHASFQFQTTIAVQPNLLIRVTKEAEAALGFGYEAQAVVDPTFVIDPSFCVDVGGICVPATELYELAQSENISVPEPAGAAPLALAGLGLVRITRRRWRRGRPTPIVTTAQPAFERVL